MISRERLGVMFILVGPGGVGKNALLNEVLKTVDDLRQLPTATTRPMRPTEQQGREHQFVSEEVFRQMLERDELLEYQEVHPGQFYGVPRATIDDAIAERQYLIADIEIYGAAVIRARYPDNSVSIFVAPPTVDALLERLHNRNASDQAIKDRMDRLPKEMLYAPLCRYVIVNDQVEQAAAELRRIIQFERGESGELTEPIVSNDVTFSVNLRIVSGRQILGNGSETSIRGNVEFGESPEKVALKLVHDTFDIETFPSRLHYGFVEDTYPFHCDFQRDQHQYYLQYNFTYHVLEDFVTPDGWMWKQNGL